VGIVAFSAHADFIWAVKPFSNDVLHIMTVAAQIRKVLDQETLGAGGMRLVAYGAYIGQNRRMDIIPFGI
jgi:hypothetical protein